IHISYVICPFFLMLRLTPTSTLFPYTTLFRSHDLGRRDAAELQGRRAAGRHRLGDVRHGLCVVGGEPRRHPRALAARDRALGARSEEHTSELQSRENLVCRLLLEKKNNTNFD